METNPGRADLYAALRRSALTAISLGCGVLLCFALLEIVLRWLPVNQGLRTLPVNDDNPVPRFAPNRTSTWSRGWNFNLINSVRTNNYGFVNDQTYEPVSSTPLLAIIGDSYVEAAMVPFEETGAGRLSRQSAPGLRVYSFGSSGAALSQYLAYARYVRETFHPDGLVVVIISNDFDESLLKYKSSPGATYFAEGERGELVLTRVDFAPSFARRLIQNSALAMYLLTNVQVTGAVDRAKDWWHRMTDSPASRYVGNTPAVVDPIRLADSHRAVDAFLDRLPGAAGLAPSAILLVLDGNRQAIYGEPGMDAGQNSYFDTMRRYVLDRGRARGFEMLDLHRDFSEHYRRHRARFEWRHDWHWNGLGHQVFAEGVARSGLYRRLSLHGSPAAAAVAHSPAH